MTVKMIQQPDQASLNLFNRMRVMWLRDQLVSLTGHCATVLACPLSRAVSLRSVVLPGLRVVLYVCAAEWLALRCAHGSPPDGCWGSGGHGAENPIKQQFQACALRR
ncbi:hypothetical protein CHARACLAT_013146 [Characodon lateralis]|uniref:Uncharacterized protein n=1 Tax=Characodon lateralis TaxID=208331 RepID=A0ABU7F2K7_9TELE|nr:hypothetical protein [Characodon lateralis]